MTTSKLPTNLLRDRIVSSQVGSRFQDRARTPIFHVKTKRLKDAAVLDLSFGEWHCADRAKVPRTTPQEHELVRWLEWQRDEGNLSSMQATLVADRLVLLDGVGSDDAFYAWSSAITSRQFQLGQVLEDNLLWKEKPNMNLAKKPKQMVFLPSVKAERLPHGQRDPQKGLADFGFDANVDTAATSESSLNAEPKTQHRPSRFGKAARAIYSLTALMVRDYVDGGFTWQPVVPGTHLAMTYAHGKDTTPDPLRIHGIPMLITRPAKADDLMSSCIMPPRVVETRDPLLLKTTLTSLRDSVKRIAGQSDDVETRFLFKAQRQAAVRGGWPDTQLDVLGIECPKT